MGCEPCREKKVSFPLEISDTKSNDLNNGKEEKLNDDKEGKLNNDIIKQKHISNSANIIELNNAETLINQMKNSLCKINLIDGSKGSGFFCKIPYPDKNNLMKVLMTNNHVINEDILNKKEINLLINTVSKNINLENRIKYTNKDYDVTIIEIKDIDNINSYLELDDTIINNLNDFKNINYIKATIYLIQYPGNKENPGVSFGIIKSIDEAHEYTFNHLCSTEEGSSGSPILASNNKLIGIHKESVNNKNFNRGTFLNYPILDFIGQNLK